MSSGPLFRVFDTLYEPDFDTIGFECHRLREARREGTVAVMKPPEGSFDTSRKSYKGNDLEVAWHHPNHYQPDICNTYRRLLGGGSPYISCSESLLWCLYWVYHQFGRHQGSLRIAVIDGGIRDLVPTEARPDTILQPLRRLANSDPAHTQQLYRLGLDALLSNRPVEDDFGNNPKPRDAAAASASEILVRGVIPSQYILSVFQATEIANTIGSYLSPCYPGRSSLAYWQFCDGLEPVIKEGWEPIQQLHAALVNNLVGPPLPEMMRGDLLGFLKRTKTRADIVESMPSTLTSATTASDANQVTQTLASLALNRTPLPSSYANPSQPWST